MFTMACLKILFDQLQYVLYIINSRYITFKLIITPYIIRIFGTMLLLLGSKFFVVGAFAKRRTNNSPSEFHYYMYMPARYVRANVSYAESISFLPDGRPFRIAVILHSMDPFLKRPVGIRSENIAKKAEKSRGVSDTRSSVMKITCTRSWHVIKIMSVARRPDRFAFKNIAQFRNQRILGIPYIHLVDDIIILMISFVQTLIAIISRSMIAIFNTFPLETFFPGLSMAACACLKFNALKHNLYSYRRGFYLIFSHFFRYRIRLFLA